jgi:hypothetical protein
MFHSIAATDAPDLEEFAKAALVADHVCYLTGEDRADFPRLRAAILGYPEGFRLYYMDDAPVGYTGLYPIAPDIFDRLHDAPHMLRHRGDMMPARDGRHIYLFNYSIAPAFRKTAYSRAMMQDYAAAVRGLDCKGLAAVTVSKDGARVAERFGLRYRGDMTHDGAPEGVYALRL